MANELTTKVTLQAGMHFRAASGAGQLVDMDEMGGNAGPSPMEMVLMGLAGCSAMDVISILRKKRQPVQAMEVNASGQRRDEFPRVFTSITLEYIVYGDGIDPQAVARAIDLSATTYCPVWAMLGKTAEITSSFRVVSAVEAPGD